MADDKKKKQNKTETAATQPQRGEAWNRFKAKEADFDIKVMPKYPNLAFADHPLTDDDELTLEEQAAYIQEEIEAYNQLTEILKNEAASMAEQVSRMQQLDVTTENLTEWRETIRKTTESIAATWQDYFTGIKEAVSQHILFDPETLSTMQEIAAALAHNDFILEKLAEYKQLEPYIQAELEKRGKKDLSELTPTELQEIEIAAREAIEADRNLVPSIRAKKMQFFHLPTTKLEKDMFHKLLVSDADKNSMPGQLVFRDIPLAVEKPGDKERTVFYSIGTSDVLTNAKLSKVLSSKEQRVHDALGSLWLAGNSIISFQQLYIAMGNMGNSNARQKKELETIVKRLADTWIEVNQEQDYSNYVNEGKGKVGFNIQQHLIYIKIAQAKINGKLVSDAIYIMEQPILFTLALDRKQLAAIPRAALETNKSQTEDYISLENYLFDRIAQMKNTKRKSSNKIKYSSMFEALGISGSSKSLAVKQSRTKKTMYERLDHYKAIKLISGYKETTNSKGEPGVEIYY